MKKLSLILLLLLLLAAVPCGNAWAADIVDSGSCGSQSSAVWTLDSDGLLTISGWGTISASAFRNRTDITSVIIEDGVAGIGDYAFMDCSSLTSVAIPNSVTGVGMFAFYGCGSMTSLALGSGLAGIGNAAFASCSGLTELTIPDSVTSIGLDAFAYCTGLIRLTIGSGVTSIGGGAFAKCVGLTGVTIPDGVTSIGEQAFTDCSGLTSVFIPASVTDIGESAFSGCSGLTNVSFGGTEEQWSGISISSGNDTLLDGTLRFNGEVDGGSCGAAGDNVTWVLTIDGLLSISGTGDMQDFSDPDYSPWYKHREIITSAVIGDGVTNIGASAFNGCSSLTGVTIPDSVTRIRNQSFYGCSGLTSVTIPDSVTNINAWAFDSCTGLEEIVLPSSITVLSQCAFQSCTSLTSVTIPNGVTTVDYWCFNGCTSLTSISMPGSVVKVNDGAFLGCTSLTTVNYGGTEEQWAGITFGNNNDPLLAAELTCVTPQLDITGQPQDFTGAAGSTIKFTVAAEGEGLTYQWYFKRAGETDFNPSTVAAATKATFTMKMADKYDGWQYYCVVTDACGQTAQSDTVTIHKAPALTITTQPKDFTGAAGSTIKFTVKASGEGLSYQWWYRKGSSGSFTKSTLAAGKKATFTMTMADKYDGWQYYCVVKDAYGQTVRSNTVTIHKTAALSITTQPASFTG
ncbi:MAG: leucine-rich repeat protein, partial [Firmicutes bacterium]|nr:leucine-rich repeat protein [Bacillota bacterium]